MAKKPEQEAPAAKPVLDIRAEIAAARERLRKTVAAPSGINISTAGKQFKSPDGQVVEGPIQVVIIDFITKYMYYPGKFDKTKPPVCFALAQDIAALVPSENSPERQDDACVNCPRNQFGLKNEAKECKNMRWLAVVAPTPDPESPIMLISVAPRGLKGFDAYVDQVDARFETVPCGVVTEISFDDTVAFEKLCFKAVEPNENLNVHWTRRAEAMKLLMVEPDISRYEAPRAAPPRVSKTGFVPSKPKGVK